MSHDPDMGELQQLFALLGNQQTHLEDCQVAMADTKARIARLRIRMSERQQRAQEGARHGASTPTLPTSLHAEPNGTPSTPADAPFAE